MKDKTYYVMFSWLDVSLVVIFYLIKLSLWPSLAEVTCEFYNILYCSHFHLMNEHVESKGE